MGAYDQAVADRVARGARRLDVAGPANWIDRINVETLDIRTTGRCVLGQVYGEFIDGADVLDLPFDGPAGVSAHGFDATATTGPLAGLDDEYDALAAAWYDLLVARIAVSRREAVRS